MPTALDIYIMCPTGKLGLTDRYPRSVSSGSQAKGVHIMHWQIHTVLPVSSADDGWSGCMASLS